METNKQESPRKLHFHSTDGGIHSVEIPEMDSEEYKLRKQSDLLTLGLLQEKNKVVELEKKLKDMKYATSSKEYQSGYIAGLTAFAWWKDGVQYVGTSGTTLRQAIAEATK